MMKATKRSRQKEFYDKLSYSLIEIIEKLQSTPGLPSITGLAEDMGMHISTLWRRVKTLHDYNVSFSADINYSALGLKRIVVITEKTVRPQIIDEKYLEYVSPIIPKGTFYQFLVGPSVIDKFVSTLKRRLDKNVIKHLGVYSYYYGPKPNLRMFYDVVEKRVKPNWEYIHDYIRVTPAHRVQIHARKVKYDEIDMFILEQLVEDPFISMREIAKRLQEAVSKREWKIDPIYSNVTYSRVRRHFLNHIIGRSMVTGIHIRLEPPSKESGVELLLMYKSKSKIPHVIASSFSEHPFTLYSLVSVEESEGATLMIVPNSHVRGLLDMMDRLEEEGLIEWWNAYVLDRHSSVRRRVKFRNLI